MNVFNSSEQYLLEAGKLFVYDAVMDFFHTESGVLQALLLLPKNCWCAQNISKERRVHC